MPKKDITGTDLRLSAIEEELKKVTRRQDEIQKSVDLLFQDRTILEDLVGSVGHLKEIILQNQEHQDTKGNSLKADIQYVAHTAEDIKSTVDDKTVIVKSKNQGLLDKILKSFKREEAK